MRNETPGKGGFTLVEITIVVAIIGMLAGIAIPNYLRCRKIAQQTTCIQNLHVIDGAVQQWAMECRKDPGEPVQYADIRIYLRHSVSCPSGGTGFDDSYQVVGVDAQPVCLRVPAGEFAHRLPL